MKRFNWHSASLPALCLVLLSSFGIHAQNPQPGSGSPADPAYLRRGDEVEQNYVRYSERLKEAYAALLPFLRKDAPQLYEKISTPPQRVQYGYQILPALAPDSTSPRARRRPSSTSYSWPRTDAMIHEQIRQVRLLLEDKIKEIAGMELEERMPVYEKMVSDYRTLQSNHRLMDHHIQHNRFWQQEVVNDKARFDRGTLLHDAVIERHAILDALSAEDEDSFRQSLGTVQELDMGKSRKELESELQERERGLFQLINQDSDKIRVPKFVQVARLGASSWAIRVPVYTDIEDDAFIQSFKDAVERFWQVKDTRNDWYLEVSLQYISSEQLYQGSEDCGEPMTETCKVPDRGEHIDLAKHVNLFPADGAALTTGANTTHVRGMGRIVLGPQTISSRMLAHEFGHVLGFPDRYFRGYSDLDAEGYEILEVISDPEDIMGSSAQGHINRRHFETLIRNQAGPNQP